MEKLCYLQLLTISHQHNKTNQKYHLIFLHNTAYDQRNIQLVIIKKKKKTQ